MKNKPFFSIVIPALNEEKYIDGILGDLKNQDYKEEFEIIVVDGNSADKTREIAKNLGAKLLISEKRHVSTQRNMGGNTAKGEYIIFFDADTRIKKNFLKELKQQIEILNPDLFSALVDTDFIGEHKLNLYEKFIITFMNICSQLSIFIGTPGVGGPFIGCKKTLFKNIQFNEHIKFAEDFEFARKSLKNGYRLQIFNNPRHQWSLRRIQKEGFLKYILQGIKINFKITTQGYESLKSNDYPMPGGQYYK